MIFNTIMVQLDVDSPAAPRATYALELARRFEASLIGFAAADSYVFVPGDDGGMAAAEIMRQRRTEIEDRLKILKEEFLSVVGDDALWREEIGDRQAVVTRTVVDSDDLEGSTEGPQVRGDRLDVVTDRLLVVPDGQNDRQLRAERAPARPSNPSSPPFC